MKGYNLSLRDLGTIHKIKTKISISKLRYEGKNLDKKAIIYSIIKY